MRLGSGASLQWTLTITAWASASVSAWAHGMGLNTHTHTHIHTHTHREAYTLAHISVYPCMHTLARIPTHSKIHTYTHIMYVCTASHICVCPNIHTCTFTLESTLSHLRSHTHTNTGTHVCLTLAYPHAHTNLQAHIPTGRNTMCVSVYALTHIDVSTLTHTETCTSDPQAKCFVSSLRFQHKLWVCPTPT